MNQKLESWYYISVGAGLALSTSSFLIISGLFESANIVGIIGGCILAGVICIVIASAVAEMASMFPSAPGIRTYLKQALGNKISLTLIYLYILMLILVAGAESYVFALVVKSVFPSVDTLYVVTGILTAVIAINLKGLELSRAVQIILTFILLSGIFLIGLFGMLDSAILLPDELPQSSWKSDLYTGVLQVPMVIGMAIFLFIGFEWITPLGLNHNSYKKKIPLSMPLAIIINMVIYSVFCLGIHKTMPSEAISSTTIPQVPYLDILLGQQGRYLACALSALAIITTFNAGLLGGARFIYALAREGNMPSYCSKISLSNGVPQGAIIFLGTLSLISAIVVNTLVIDLFAAIVSSAIICFVYGGLVLSLPYLRKKKASRPRPFISPFPIWVYWVIGALMPILGIASLVTITDIAEYCITFFAICLIAAIAAAYYQDRKTDARPLTRKVKEYDKSL